MTEQHPIIPPQWQIDAWQACIETMGADLPVILLEVAQWGADTELEACLEWLEVPELNVDTYKLRADRRPERLNRPEANSKPIPNPSQIRSSLVERVHSCIVGEPECGHMQARAAIREMLAYLREHELIGSYAQGQLNAELRRPKPLSLKKQALLILDDANLDAVHENILRRALEQLDD